MGITCRGFCDQFKVKVATKIPRYSKEKIPIPVVMMINQKLNPAVTANALNLGDENSILNRINECG